VKLDKELAIALHGQGFASSEIAERFGVTPPTVHKVLRAAGIRQRPPIKRKQTVNYAQRDVTGEPVYQDRDPCAKCGVRGDFHATMGCPQYERSK